MPFRQVVNDATLRGSPSCTVPANPKRRVQHWRKVLVPLELVQVLKMVHRLRDALSRRIREPLWNPLGVARIARSLRVHGLTVVRRATLIPLRAPHRTRSTAFPEHRASAVVTPVD